MPMWCRRPAWRRVTVPSLTLSVRTRLWVRSVGSVGGFGARGGFGAGLVGRGWGASGQGSVAAFVVVLMAEGLEEVCSCWIVAGGAGCLRSQFFIVCWKRSTL